MRTLSATECISPAIERTKLVLFTPFRKGRSWKLSATAYLALCGQMFAPFPLLYLIYLPQVRRFGTWAVYALAGGVVATTVLYLVVFYLCSRIRFAWFDILVNRGEFVAPAWRKYGHQTVAWTAFKFVFGCVFALATAAPMVSYVRNVMTAFLAIQPGQPPSAEYFSAIMTGYGLLFLIFGTFAFISGLLADFVVPSLALEDTSLAEAFRRMGALIRNEPGEFALYALLKTVLGLAAYLGVTIAFEIVVLLFMLVVFLVLGIVGFLLHLAGVPTAVLIVVGGVIGFGLEMVVLVYGLLLAIGPVLTFLDAYALYFLGGRYPMLGDLLDRSTPPAVEYAYPYPVQPPGAWPGQ
jgi:hypothetical protein